MQKRHAGAVLAILLMVLPGSIPLASSVYIGPRVKVEPVSPTLPEGGTTQIIVTVLDFNGSRVPGATVRMSAELGTFEDNNLTTSGFGTCTFVYRAPASVAYARSDNITAVAMYGSPPYTNGTGGVWVYPPMNVVVSGPSQVLKGGGPVRYDITVTAAGQPVPGVGILVNIPEMGNATIGSSPTDGQGKAWFTYAPPANRNGPVNLYVTATCSTHGSSQGSIEVTVVDTMRSVEVTVSADQNPLPSWGSCNLTAAVTSGGSLVFGAVVDWGVSKGMLSAARATTSTSGRSVVQYTALGDAPGPWAGAVNISARASYQGSTGEGTAVLSIAPYATAWTGSVGHSLNRRDLYPGEKLMVEASVDQPDKGAWQFIASFKVVTELRRTSGEIVHSHVLGENLSLSSPMSWASGTYDMLVVPENPVDFIYLWDLKVLSANGLRTYWQLPAPLRVNVLTTGRDSWTILIFNDGDNNLDYQSQLFHANLEDEGASDNVRVLFEWDRYDPAWGIRRYDMGQLVETLPDNNSALFWLLPDFLEWGARYAPAQHYALMIWDHGGAFFGASSVTNRNLADRMKDFRYSHREIEVVIFDCCLMSSFETAYQLRGASSYLVASEEMIIRDLFTPDALHLLKGRYPDSPPTALQFSQDVLKGFNQSYDQTDYPLAIIDLSKVQPVFDDLNVLGGLLHRNWNDVYYSFLDTVGYSKGIEGPYLNVNEILVDMRSMIDNLTLNLQDGPFFSEYGECIAASSRTMQDYLDMVKGRVNIEGLDNVNVFLPSYYWYQLKHAQYYIHGLPSDCDWVRFLDHFYDAEDSQGGSQSDMAPFSGMQEYGQYPLEEPACDPVDLDADGNYEFVEANLSVDQENNSAPVTLVMDTLAFCGTRAAGVQGLVGRQTATIPAGTTARPNFLLTSPLNDLVGIVLTVLTDKGAILQQFYLGSFMMNATPVRGRPPDLMIAEGNISAVAGRPVQFVANVSDPDGDSVTVWWDFDREDGIGIDATGRSANASYRGTGRRTAVVIASDGANVVQRTLNVTVAPNPGNRPPNVNFTVSYPDSANPHRLRFNASASSDPDGDHLEYAFAFGDGNWTGWNREESIDHVYPGNGTYNCIVRVRDPGDVRGVSRILELKLTGRPPNRPPVPALELSAQRVNAGKKLTARLSAIDPDPDESVQFRIDWGDGDITGWTGSTIQTHSYSGTGSFNITLTARDGGNLSASVTATVQVTAAPKTIQAKGFLPGATALALAIAVLAALALTSRRREGQARRP